MTHSKHYQTITTPGARRPKRARANKSQPIVREEGMCLLFRKGGHVIEFSSIDEFKRWLGK